MLEVFDRGRKKLAILENAFDIVSYERLNALNTLTFSLPGYDAKNAFCQGFNLVRYNDGEYYRIVKLWEDEGEQDVYTYEAEHVIALLLNKSMFGYVVIGNIGVFTVDVLSYILNQQSDWVLTRCDFSRQFEYGWEQENLYGALLSVPNRFTEKYMFSYNTKRYPYEMSLIKLDENAIPVAYVRRGFNRIKYARKVEWTKIVTKLYPLGAGEGINQLNIKDVNNGSYFITASPDSIARYGTVEYIWVDRRYTDAQSLLDAGRAMLAELQEPYIEYEVDFVADNARIGDIVEIVGETRNFIVEIETRHSENDRKYYKIANKPYDVASALADVQDRQRIEMVYSQGATQIYADSIAENADASNSADLRFYIVESMPIINAIKCKIRLSTFRAYSAATSSGGSIQTSSDGGGSSPTSSAGGGGTSTSSNGGGTQTSTGSGGGEFKTTSVAGKAAVTSESSSINTTGSSGGIDQMSGSPQNISYITGTTSFTSATGLPNHAHVLESALNIIGSHTHRLNITSHTHGMSHTHTVNTPDHSHTISISDHTHSMSIGTHSHTVSFGTHSHTVTISAHSHTVNTTHSHSVTPGIFHFGGATGFNLFVNGVDRGFFATTDIELDITAYFIRDGKIPRGSWHTISVKPNALARAEISYNLQGFIQSRGGGTY